ncbi:MAG: type II toxin-antitoxin system VapC family toxin [Deltaproteobacteria bacterium]|nr:type II toxin-antitoxin system VapC family toxin [Deltaproteobacteria bacterium]
MLAVDTNVLVRLITRDDATQVASAEQFLAHGAWISHLVLVETSWVLDASYDLTPEAIATAIEMLLNHGTLVIQDPEVVQAALEHFRKKPAVGFSDCMVLEVARKAGHSPLGTFDRNLSKLPGAKRI